MACAFSDSLMASGGGSTRPEISGSKHGMTMKFLPDVGIHREARNQKCFFDISGLICKLQTKTQKIPTLKKATYRHANFTKFCRIVHIDIGIIP